MTPGRKIALPQIHYSLGPQRVSRQPTHRSYPYRFRQTRRGRVGVTPEDTAAILAFRASRRAATAQPAAEA
ncbi:MAG: hypothetical protein QJR03_02185 [Sphaerobacter sp.]|nr:hypothetical protein [Sphaerobacter sp.]